MMAPGLIVYDARGHPGLQLVVVIHGAAANAGQWIFPLAKLELHMDEAIVHIGGQNVIGAILGVKSIIVGDPDDNIVGQR